MNHRRHVKTVPIKQIDNNNNKAHIKKRKSVVIGAVAKLLASGISSENMHPVIQAEMFKTHVRPILFYSLENLHLSHNDMKKIKRRQCS